MQKLNRKLIIIFCVFLALFLALFIVVGCNVKESQYVNDTCTKIDDNSDYATTPPYLRVFDTYDETIGFAAAQQQKDFLSKSKYFNNDLHSSPDFYFFEMIQQPLEYLGFYEGPNEFVKNYEIDQSMKNQTIHTSDGEKYLTPIYAIQLDEAAINHFQLMDKVIDGHLFEHNDFYYNTGNSNQIPCIMGNLYKLSGYSVNQTITFNYLNRSVDLMIIGFFDEKTAIFSDYDNARLYLDNYIIMPSLNCTNDPYDNEDDSFQKKLYDQKNWGYLVNEGLNYVKLIEDIAKKYDLPFTTYDTQITKNE